MAKIDELLWEPKRKNRAVVYYNLDTKQHEKNELFIEDLSINTDIPNTQAFCISSCYTNIQFKIDERKSKITRFYDWARGRKFDFDIDILDPAGVIIERVHVKNAILSHVCDEGDNQMSCTFMADWYTTEITDTVKTIECQLTNEYADYLNKQIIDNVNNIMEKDYIFTSPYIDAATDNLRNNQTYVSSDPIEAIRKTFDTEQVSSEDMLI